MIFDWDDPADFSTLGIVLDWELVSVSSSVAATYTQILHARATDTILHAEQTMGARNFIYTIADLVDESGVGLVDETGASLTAYGQTPVIVLHAGSTDTLLHGEDL